MYLSEFLQKADPHGKITSTTAATITGATTNNEQHGMMAGMQQEHASSTTTSNATDIVIVKGAATLGNKAFSPNDIKIKVGRTVVWTNNDNNIHTVTSGVPNTPNAGQVFDSGLASLIAPSKTYSHKFTNAGEFSYFCRLHPTMVGKIEVTQ